MRTRLPLPLPALPTDARSNEPRIVLAKLAFEARRAAADAAIAERGSELLRPSFTLKRTLNMPARQHGPKNNRNRGATLSLWRCVKRPVDQVHLCTTARRLCY